MPSVMPVSLVGRISEFEEPEWASEIAHLYRSEGPDPVLRCTGRANPYHPLSARPRRPPAADRRSSRTRPTPTLRTTSTSPATSPAARVQRRLHLDLPGGRRDDPGRPGPADPLERPLDAARLDRPGPVHLALRPDRVSPRRCRSRSSARIAAPLTWAIARDAGASAVVAIGAGVLISIPGLMTIFMSQPDNFGLYQPLVAGALWMAARGLKGHPGSFVLGGCSSGWRRCRGTTALLVGAVLGLAFLYDRWRAWRSGGGRVPAIPLVGGGRCFALFLLVMAPWWIRQLAVFGQLSPSTVVGQGPLHPDDRGMELDHEAGDARLPARDGLRTAARSAGSAGSSPRSISTTR